MTASTAAAPQGEFEHQNGAGDAGPTGAEHHPDTEGLDPLRLKLNATSLASLGIVAAASLGVLMQTPDLRKACLNILNDSEVQDVCREAGTMVHQALASAWQRHDGPAALASILYR